MSASDAAPLKPTPAWTTTGAVHADTVDPDPFSIGLGIFGAVAGAGSWLEARRQRANDDRRDWREFRATWFACVRSVDFLDSSIREFATHVAEQEFGGRTFRFGGVRIGFTGTQARQGFARLSRQVDITKANLTENFDKLSEYLDPLDASDITTLLGRLQTSLAEFPQDYSMLVDAGRRSTADLRAFLERVGDRQRFRIL